VAAEQGDGQSPGGTRPSIQTSPAETSNRLASPYVGRTRSSTRDRLVAVRTWRASEVRAAQQRETNAQLWEEGKVRSS